MTTEELKQKYGDEMVLVLPASAVTCAPGKGPYYDDDDIDFCVKRDAIPALRYQVENDPGYKQLVMYAVIRDESGRIFTTMRRSGDPRLTGQYSIGTGGHMQPDEMFFEALFRELEEEVGITPDDVSLVSRTGYILDTSSPVNSVHLGVVWNVVVKNPDVVRVRETEKLVGSWVTLDTLFAMNRLESWSEYIVNELKEERSEPHDGA